MPAQAVGEFWLAIGRWRHRNGLVERATVPRDSGKFSLEGEASRSSLTEKGEECGQAANTGRTTLAARFLFEEVSWADPMEPAPAIISGRRNDSKGTPGLLALSRRPQDGLHAGLTGRTYLMQEAA